MLFAHISVHCPKCGKINNLISDLVMGGGQEDLAIEPIGEELLYNIKKDDFSGFGFDEKREDWLKNQLTDKEWEVRRLLMVYTQDASWTENPAVNSANGLGLKQIDIAEIAMALWPEREEELMDGPSDGKVITKLREMIANIISKTRMAWEKFPQLG